MVVVAVTINLSSLETPTDPDRPRITSRYKNSAVGASGRQERLGTVVKQYCHKDLEAWVTPLEDVAQVVDSEGDFGCPCRWQSSRWTQFGWVRPWTRSLDGSFSGDEINDCS